MMPYYKFAAGSYPYRIDSKYEIGGMNKKFAMPTYQRMNFTSMIGHGESPERYARVLNSEISGCYSSAKFCDRRPDDDDDDDYDDDDDDDDYDDYDIDDETPDWSGGIHDDVL